MKTFYDSLKEVYDPTNADSSPLLSADGAKPISEKNKTLEMWAQHFDSVLNRPSSINDKAIKRLPEVPMKESLDVTPTRGEVQIAICQLSSGKEPRSDSIPVEIYEEGGSALTAKLLSLIQLIGVKEQQPQDFKDSSIIHIYKWKGNWKACDNHRGISLLSISCKFLARVLLYRLNSHLEHGLLPESQCGFRKGRGTVDMVFAARQLQEKCQEQNTDLDSTYVDLKKVFDTVSRYGLWRIMVKYGCREKFITIVRQFHNGMHAKVQDNRESSIAFLVTNGVNQGCFLVPTLLSIMFSAKLFGAWNGSDNGIDILYCTIGSVFNHWRLQAKTKVKSDIIKFLFAEDCALNTTTKANMQNSVNKFSMACDNFGLTISTRKTKVKHLLAHGKPFIKPNITTKGQRLKVVEKFTDLGSTLYKSIDMDDEVNSKLAKNYRCKSYSTEGIYLS